MLSNEQIANLVSVQLAKDHGLKVDPTLNGVSSGRDGDQYFDLDVNQEFGIFKTIIKRAWVGIRAGQVTVVNENDKKQTTVMASLNYEHPSGGTNGSSICTYWFEGEVLVNTRQNKV